MEVKKSKKADLENRRGLFMEIGLIVALAAVIIMFSVSQREKVVEVMAPVATVDEVEMIDVTTEKEPEPEPVQHQQTGAVITDVLNVVRNDTKIETSIGWVDFEDEDIEIAPIQVETEEIEEETIFIVADQKPSFQGGDLNVFRNWVQARLSYPPLAQENNIQGTVTVKFVVEKDGRLTNIQVLKSPDKTLSDEAVSVLSQSPKWEPARPLLPSLSRYNRTSTTTHPVAQRRLPAALLHCFPIYRPPQRIVGIDMQAMSCRTQAGDAMDMVLEAPFRTDGIKTERRLHDDRTLQAGVSRCGRLKNFDEKSPVREKIAGELRMGMDTRPVSLLPTHHDGLPPRFGRASEIGTTVAVGGIVIEPVQRMVSEPRHDILLYPFAQPVVYRTGMRNLQQSGEKGGVSVVFERRDGQIPG